MQNNFVGKHFLTLEDYTPEDLRYLLDLALRLKKEKKRPCRPAKMHRRQYAYAFRNGVHKNPLCIRNFGTGSRNGNDLSFQLPFRNQRNH